MTNPIQVSEWLLAEQVRHTEQAQGRFKDDASANAVAREQGLDLGQRIAQRAKALPSAQAVLADFRHLKKLFVWFCLALGLIAVLAAIGAVRLAIDQREIEILAVVASLLGLPTAFLLLWLIGLVVWRQPSKHNLLTAASRSMFRRLGPLVLSGPGPDATLAAVMGLFLTPAGRWLLGSVSHAFWLAYLLSALCVLTVLLTVSQYDLGWGTTLLSDAHALELLALLAYLPENFGLISNQDTTWLEAGRLGVAPELVRAPWAKFLLALVLVYGLLPRLIALVFSAVFAWSGFHRLGLDLKQPGYLRLSGLLMPPKPMSFEDGVLNEPSPRTLRVAEKDALGVITVVVEVGSQERAEPLFGLDEATDLGMMEARADRERVLGALSVRKQPAAFLVVQCTARRTPDRGLIDLINQLADAAGGGLTIALSDMDGLEDWGVAPSARLADWHRLARQTGGQIQSRQEARATVSGVS